MGSEAPSSREGSWLAALFASSLFILIHGRDGLAQGGQRDLTIAVCLLAATAFLLKILRQPGKLWAAAAFGLFSGIALTVKPTTALLTLAQLLLAAYVLRRDSTMHKENSPSANRSVLARYIGFAAAGYLIAPAICLIFLLREHALNAFLATFHSVIPYYASLGHRPLGYILLHSVSPILSLVILWLAVLALDRPPLFRPHLDLTRALLWVGVLFGLINCIVQARALPYYRYPLLAFLLPLMAIDFTRAAQIRIDGTLPTKIARVLAAAALLVGGFFLAPQSAILIHRFRWRQTDFVSSLEQNLQALGGSRLNRHIQCIDTNSGCGNVLYAMRLESSTGLLSDFFLFNPAPGFPDTPVVRQTREQFSNAILAHPPEVIVVTSRLYLSGPDNYDNYRKLDLWPAFQTFLATNYTLTTDWSPPRTERWWSREELPAGYRIYALRGAHPQSFSLQP